MKYCFSYNTMLGIIEICADEKAILNLSFGKAVVNAAVAETPLILEAYRQLAEYLNGARKSFDLPLNLQGTAFQKSVWKVLQAIPYGQIKTYRKIAEEIGYPKAARAVGIANNKNPLPIFIPCHRVIGANGSLTGYLGGLAVKQTLLDLEKRYAIL